jgi:hypothetical protein
MKISVLFFIISSLSFLPACTICSYDPSECHASRAGRTHAELKREGYDFWQRNPDLPLSAFFEGWKQIGQ